MVPEAAPQRSGNSLICFGNLNVIFSHTPEATPHRSFAFGSMPFGSTSGVRAPDLIAEAKLPSRKMCCNLSLRSKRLGVKFSNPRIIDRQFLSLVCLRLH